MDRIDEAVETYLQVECQAINGDDTEYLRCSDRDREIVRAALLAGVKVLLGEPVAWQYRFNHPLPSGGMCEWHTCDLAYANTLPRVAYDVRPLYAPSLGEGE